MRRDELRAAWAIYTPLLHSIDKGEIDPEPYPYGSRGPPSLDHFLEETGYNRSTKYVWTPKALVAEKEQGVSVTGEKVAK